MDLFDSDEETKNSSALQTFELSWMDTYMTDSDDDRCWYNECPCSMCQTGCPSEHPPFDEQEAYEEEDLQEVLYPGPGPEAQYNMRKAQWTAILVGKVRQKHDRFKTVKQKKEIKKIKKGSRKARHTMLKSL